MTQVEIETDVDQAINELKGLRLDLDGATKQFVRESMQDVVQEVSREKNKKFRDGSFDNNLDNDLSVENIRDLSRGDTIHLRLPIKGNTPRDADYVRWHEFAREGHKVKVEGNRPLERWVDQEFDGPSDINVLKVTPAGPFIRPGFRRAVRRIRQKSDTAENPVVRTIE